MNALKLTPLFFGLALAITGCSSGDSDSTATTNGATDGATTSGSGATSNGLTMPAAFQGRWVRDCLPDDGYEAEGSEYEITTMDISDNQLTQSERLYTDNTCTTLVSQFYSYESTFSITVQPGSISTSQGDALPIDLNLQTASIDGKEYNRTEQWYDITKIIDNRLYFGDASASFTAGETAEERLTTLDFFDYYERP